MSTCRHVGCAHRIRGKSVFIIFHSWASRYSPGATVEQVIYWSVEVLLDGLSWFARTRGDSPTASSRLLSVSIAPHIVVVRQNFLPPSGIAVSQALGDHGEVQSVVKLSMTWSIIPQPLITWALASCFKCVGSHLIQHFLFHTGPLRAARCTRLGCLTDAVDHVRRCPAIRDGQLRAPEWPGLGGKCEPCFSGGKRLRGTLRCVRSEPCRALPD